MSTFKAISREQGSENTLHQHLLGFFVRPVQPINAELVVDVAFPGDETAVESVQQFGGNLVLAMLVLVAKRAAKLYYQLLLGVPLLASDIRGDVMFMMALAVSTFYYYRSFDAPLRRSMVVGGCTAVARHRNLSFGRRNLLIAAPQFFYWPARSFDCHSKIFQLAATIL
jgi:hypothetical protein